MKYRLLIFIFMFFACLTVVGQVNQVWWSKGRVLHVNPVKGIDSVTFGQFVNADTFLIVIDRASRRIVYDTIDEHVHGMVFHDTIHTTHTVYLKPGRRIGVFSVAKDRQVSFSQGNLQYVRNQDVWIFADQQYEYIGARNVKDGELANKIDLFGWSADNTTAPFGVSTSTNAADYAGEFVDWGVNEINGEAPNTWRTLSQEEWGYIFESRKNAKQLYSKGSIDGVRGMIVLPDDWVLPEGLHFTAAPDNLTMDLDINIYTRAQWQKMEEAGAVFLCPTGRRDGLNIGYLVEYGGYWSSSRAGSNRVKHLYFNYESLIFNTNYNSGDQSYGYNGRAVRLVHDTIVPPPAPCETFEVNGVEFNMMCVEGGTFMMGAGSDAHQVTLSDYLIAETELTQELWEAVMNESYDTILSTHNLDVFQKGPNYPAYGLTWYDAQEFIERLNKLTGLQFRMPTEAEWEFAARGGNKSKGYKYAGGDNIDEVAWHALNSDNKMHIVATKKPNELGIYDMTGNSWELCLDGYAAYPTYSQTNPLVPLRTETVVRGGSSYSSWVESNYLITYRFNRAPNALHNRNTLRLVLSDEVVVKTIVIDNKMAFNMRMVEGGTFMMGATDGDSNAGENEFPIHSVTLSDYYISQISVTQELWADIMGTSIDEELVRNNGETGLGKGDDYPMYCITWFQAQEFAERLSQLTGCLFRLPTEAEWEYAARGGKYSKGYKYAGSDNIDEVAWYQVTGGKVKPNALLKPNELGLYDMSGNIWDWVLDGYSEYTDEPQIDPCVPRETDVVERGGSSHSGWGVYCNRVSFRAALDPMKARTRVGIRLVMVEPE